MLLDAASGGLLGGLGTLVAGSGGAVSGAIGAVKYADQIAQIKVRGIPTGGQMIACGPAKNPNFPFVLLGRALLHQRLVCTRTHADRNELKLEMSLLEWLSDKERKRLARLFEDIRNSKKVDERRAALAERKQGRQAGSVQQRPVSQYLYPAAVASECGR